MGALQLAYLLSDYPGLTTTFADREVAALREMGVQVSVLAMSQPDSMVSPEQVQLQSLVTYVQPYRTTELLMAHLRSLLTHPLRYISTLFYILYLFTRPHPTGTRRGDTFHHFVIGVMCADLLRHNPPDHLHVDIVDLSTVGLVISRMLEIPYSVTAHASGDIYVRPLLLEERFCHSKFVAACTRYNQEFLQMVGRGSFGDKVKCIYHGLDLRRYHRTRPVEQTQRPVILGVGELKERKGFHTLLDALGLLRQWGVNFECRIVGEGPMRDVLEEKIFQNGLGEQVKLLGALPHPLVFEQYEAAHIFALPTVVASDGDQDGIPNVILEAMAMELPVVSTWHLAIPEAVAVGKNGLLVPPGDWEALAKALAWLIRRPEMRAAYGASGRATVAALFQPHKNARMLLKEIQTAQ